jgi:alpha-galactosidase
MVLNRNAAPRAVSFDWAAESVRDDLSRRDAGFDKTRYALRDLWLGRDAGLTDRPLRAELPGHDVLVLRLTPTR